VRAGISGTAEHGRRAEYGEEEEIELQENRPVTSAHGVRAPRDNDEGDRWRGTWHAAGSLSGWLRRLQHVSVRVAAGGFAHGFLRGGNGKGEETMKLTRNIGITLGVFLAGSAAAVAQEPFEEPALPPEEPEAPIIRRGPGAEHLRTPMGTSIQLGGGVRNFLTEETRDVTGVGGYWDVRAAIGTRSFVGLELAYVGNAQNIEAPGLSPDAALVGHGAEGAIRLQAPLVLQDRFYLSPFVLGGIGWLRYGIVNDDAAASPVAANDNVLTVPLGVGIGFGYRGFIADARFTFRPTFNEDLIPATATDEDFTRLHSWGAGVTLGYEF
jgi:hypothetical protein